AAPLGLLLAQAQSPRSAPNEVLVKWRPGVGPAGLSAVAGPLDLARSEPVGGSGWVRLVSRTQNARALMNFLKARSDVLEAEEDYVVHATAIPNDPAFLNGRSEE